MICSRCKKYPAVVFLTSNDKKDPSQGLCIKCAKDLKIGPVTDLMDKMGISDEDIDMVQEELADLIPLDENGELKDGEELYSKMLSSDPESFSFINNLFNNSNSK